MPETSRSQPLSGKKCLCCKTSSHRHHKDDDNDHLDPTRNDLKCPFCVHTSLKPFWDRHMQAKKDRDLAKQECASSLNETLEDHHALAELQSESRRLRDRLSVLNNKCSEMAVRVASRAVENDSRQASLPSNDVFSQKFDQLQLLDDSLVHGSMNHAIQVATNQVRVLRFQWARKAMAMHRLDIDQHDVKPLEEKQQRKQQQRRARGIGKIGGLPLPHAGPELYSVLPPRELQSALRLVASVTSTVARCLGIILPHPILLTPVDDYSWGGDISDFSKVPNYYSQNFKTHAMPKNTATTTTTTTTSTARNAQSNLSPQPSSVTGSFHSSLSSLPSASSSLLNTFVDTSYWKRSAKSVLAKATGQKTPSVSQSSSKTHHPTTTNHHNFHSDTDRVSKRIHHSTAAVLLDQNDGGGGSEFALSVQQTEEFPIALQLLQNDVISLCIRAGVPVSQLWPTEAMLLNLYALDLYCDQQTRKMIDY